MITPMFLGDLFRTVVVMSISGGLLALLLFAIRPLVRRRLPKVTQYYLWLVVLVALVIPFSRFVSMPSGAVAAPLPHTFVERNVISLGEEAERHRLNAPIVIAPSINAPADTLGNHEPLPQDAAPPVADVPNAFFVMASTIIMMIYPWIAAAVLLFSIVGYVRFKIRITRTNIAALPHEIAELTHLGSKLRLFRNKTAQTPMLIGILRPMIVLPDREYTPWQLEAVLLHELTHYRRRDVAVKWLTLLASALHWFNPFVWLARREIHRICELACDEAVISKMSNAEKQSYGNTLIEVAADARLPQSILSTTMCEEKHALKERLGAIMTNKKHTRLAVFVSVLVVLAATLAACALGAGSGSGSGADVGNGTDDTDVGAYMTASAYSRQHYADAHIERLAAGLTVFREDDGSVNPANIIETQLNQFEQVAEFDHIFPQTLELWRLDFQLLTTDIEDGNVRWGTFAPDAYGWVGHHTGWNDARILLIFAQVEGGFSFMGYVPWHFELHADTTTTWGLEMALRGHLEEQGLISPVSINSGHYLVYFDFGGVEYTRLLVSSPDGNIWIVEREQPLGGISFDRNGNYHVTLALPMIPGWDGTIAAQTVYLQAQFEQGLFAAIGDPITAAQHYFETYWGVGTAIFVDAFRVPHGTTNPFGIPPHIFEEMGYSSDAADFEQALVLLSAGTIRGDVEAAFGYAIPDGLDNRFFLEIGGGTIDATLGFDQYNNLSWGYIDFITPDAVRITRRLTPVGYVDVQLYPTISPNMGWPVISREPQHLALREQVIEQIGGLDFNQAYMFAMGDGTYALITGWRPLTSAAELNHYFPHINLPEQIGDFTLRRVTVENGGIADGVRIYRDRVATSRVFPLYGASFWPPELAPLNQIFTMFEGLDMPPPMWAFYALYEDSDGNFVGLTAQMPIMIADNEWWSEIGVPFITSSVDPNLHFRGEGKRFYFASLEEGLGPIVRLSVRGNPHDLSLDHQWFYEDGFGLIPTDLATLEGLAQIFDLRGLLVQYDWHLTSWQ